MCSEHLEGVVDIIFERIAFSWSSQIVSRPEKAYRRQSFGDGSHVFEFLDKLLDIAVASENWWREAMPVTRWRLISSADFLENCY